MTRVPRTHDVGLTRRSFLHGAAAVAAAGLIGCTGRDRPRPPALSSTSPTPPSCDARATDQSWAGRVPLWQAAIERGIVFGSSAATWQLTNPAYRRLLQREAAIVFTEDDLLWYRIRPHPRAELDLSYGDRIVEFAEREGMLVLGAHLVWDEGFGDGWSDEALFSLGERRARDLLFGTVEEVVRHYRGRVAGWSVANEVVDGGGLRTDVPWHKAVGPSYVAEAFEVAHDADPDALLLLNDFGFENDDGFAPTADKRAATLQLLDELLEAAAPVHALGVQAHLHAQRFVQAFDAGAYLEFLAAVADRGLEILITEMDVLDDGLPASIDARDRAVADTVRGYLDVALTESAVGTLMTFGLSDRYTWLEEDDPRTDGVARRPLPFDDELRPKPAYGAVMGGVQGAAPRAPTWVPSRC